jgi:hypothetical protein
VELVQFAGVVAVDVVFQDDTVLCIGERDDGDGVLFLYDAGEAVLELLAHLWKACPHGAADVTAEDMVDRFTNLDGGRLVGVLDFVFVDMESLGDFIGRTDSIHCLPRCLDIAKI